MPLQRPVVFVVYAEITAPVVRSQTMPLARALREAGNRVEAAVFTSPRRLVVPSAWVAHREALNALADACGARPIQMTHRRRDRGLDRHGHTLANELRRRRIDSAVLFCRQPRAALVGIAARAIVNGRGGDLKVVLDLRGIRDVEYLLTLGRDEGDLTAEETGRLRAYRDQEAVACTESDGVLCVSRAMLDLVGRRYGVDASRVQRIPNHARVVPYADDLRGAARGELDVTGGALLVAYCGTLAAWQMAEESALLVRALAAHRPDVRVLYLTPQADEARGVIRRVGLEGAMVRSVPQEEVPRWLAAADYGLLLRQDTTVNRVACPVKFGEYLACGLRPVLTPRIGDQSDVAIQDDLGVVVGMQDVNEAAKRIALDAARPGTVDEAGRRRRRQWAGDNISPERAAARLEEFLARVAAC